MAKIEDTPNCEHKNLVFHATTDGALISGIEHEIVDKWIEENLPKMQGTEHPFGYTELLVQHSSAIPQETQRKASLVLKQSIWTTINQILSDAAFRLLGQGSGIYPVTCCINSNTNTSTNTLTHTNIRDSGILLPHDRTLKRGDLLLSSNSSSLGIIGRVENVFYDSPDTAFDIQYIANIGNSSFFFLDPIEFMRRKVTGGELINPDGSIATGTSFMFTKQNDSNMHRALSELFSAASQGFVPSLSQSPFLRFDGYNINSGGNESVRLGVDVSIAGLVGYKQEFTYPNPLGSGVPNSLTNTTPMWMINNLTGTGTFNTLLVTNLLSLNNVNTYLDITNSGFSVDLLLTNRADFRPLRMGIDFGAFGTNNNLRFSFYRDGYQTFHNSRLSFIPDGNMGNPSWTIDADERFSLNIKSKHLNVLSSAMFDSLTVAKGLELGDDTDYPARRIRINVSDGVISIPTFAHSTSSLSLSRGNVTIGQAAGPGVPSISFALTTTGLSYTRSASTSVGHSSVTTPGTSFSLDNEGMSYIYNNIRTWSITRDGAAIFKSVGSNEGSTGSFASYHLSQGHFNLGTINGNFYIDPNYGLELSYNLGIAPGSRAVFGIRREGHSYVLYGNSGFGIDINDLVRKVNALP